MNRIIAAVDNSPAARPVLTVAATVQPIFEARAEALHVREDGERVAQSAAEALGLPFRTLEGDVVHTIAAAAGADDVAALVVGAREAPWGKRPAGHIALQLMTSVRKPVVVVPPETPSSFAVHRLLVPLEGAASTATALSEIVRLACLCGIEVIVAHVFDERSVPMFEDHAGHEKAAWRDEFLARNCPEAPATLELRTGVPGDQIVGAIAGTDADVVALGWSQDLSPGRARVVRDVLERSDVPVMLLPVTQPATTRSGERSAVGGRLG